MKINKNTANASTYCERYSKKFYVYCAATTFFSESFRVES